MDSYQTNQQGDDPGDSGFQMGDYWQVIRNRYEVILLSLLLVFATAAVITSLMPEKFESTVVVQLHNITNSRGELSNDLTAGVMLYSSPNFIANQFERISSELVLLRVVQEVDLVNRWRLNDEKQAIIKLRNALQTESRRGTDVVEIRVVDEDRDLAAIIAQNVYQAYESSLDNDVNRVNYEAGIHLDTQLGQQMEKVKDARIAMHKAMKDLKVIDLAKSSGYRSDEVITPEDGIIVSGEQRVDALKYEISGLRSQLEGLVDIEGAEMVRLAQSLGIQDPTIQRYYAKFNDLMLEEQQALESGLGQNHPTVRAIQTQLTSVKTILMEAAADARRSIEIQLEQLESRLEVAVSTQETSKNDYISNSLDKETYNIRREEYRTEKDILKALTLQAYTEKIERTAPIRPVTVLEHAHPAAFAKSPNKPLNLILGAVLGLAFGLGIAFMLEFMDTSVKSIEDVERYLKVPVLAVIPKDVGLLHKESGLSPDAEAYRILRTNIEFNRKSADANSITMVSGGAGEGKSTTLINLAYVCAQGGYNTLMIDGDLRRPTLHTHFEINNSVGLTNYLTTDLQLEDVILQTPIENLYFMPSGILPADAAGILNSRRMSELIQDVKSRFDLVLVDSPPILGVSDASVLASEVDLTVVVIQHRKLPRNMLVRVKKAVESVGGTLLGVVLNNVDIRSDSQYQYYTSYYTYYAPSRDGGSDPAVSRPKDKEARSTTKTADVSVDEDVY